MERCNVLTGSQWVALGCNREYKLCRVLPAGVVVPQGTTPEVSGSRISPVCRDGSDCASAKRSNCSRPSTRGLRADFPSGVTLIHRMVMDCITLCIPSILIIDHLPFLAGAWIARSSQRAAPLAETAAAAPAPADPAPPPITENRCERCWFCSDIHGPVTFSISQHQRRRLTTNSKQRSCAVTTAASRWLQCADVGDVRSAIRC